MKRIVLILLVVVLAANSCVKPSDIHVSDPKIEEFGVRSFNEFTFYASANIENPTCFTFNVVDTYFDITYESTPLGNITAEPIPVMAHSDERHATRCVLKIDEKITFLEVLKYAKNFDTEKVYIDGYATARLRCGIHKTVHIYHKTLKELLSRYEKNTDNSGASAPSSSK